MRRLKMRQKMKNVDQDVDNNDKKKKNDKEELDSDDDDEQNEETNSNSKSNMNHAIIDITDEDERTIKFCPRCKIKTSRRNDECTNPIIQCHVAECHVFWCWDCSHIINPFDVILDPITNKHKYQKLSIGCKHCRQLKRKKDIQHIQMHRIKRLHSRRRRLSDPNSLRIKRENIAKRRKTAKRRMSHSPSHYSQKNIQCQQLQLNENNNHNIKPIIKPKKRLLFQQNLPSIY